MHQFQKEVLRKSNSEIETPDTIIVIEDENLPSLDILDFSNKKIKNFNFSPNLPYLKTLGSYFSILVVIHRYFGNIKSLIV